MGLIEDFTDVLAREVAGALDEDAKARIAALFSVRSVMPNADVFDRIRLARYIVTGNDEPPEPQENPYPHASGDVTVLGPGIFANTTAPAENTVLNWQGGNFVPQRESSLLVPARPLWVGDRISIEDHDGRGVSGYVTDWTTEDGGSRFTVYAGPERLKAQTEGEPDPAEIPELLPETEPAPTEGEGWAGRRG
jgi:hypothetical protein